MKACICDFCGLVIRDDDTRATLYDISIYLVGDFHEEGQSFLFSAEHVCRRCAALAHRALTDVKTLQRVVGSVQRTNRAHESAGKQHPTPQGRKAKS
jgi:hypothetical protein